MLRRGTGYGIFTAAHGLAWLVGSTAIGALYSHSITAVTAFVVAAQILAFALFIPARGRSAPMRSPRVGNGFGPGPATAARSAKAKHRAAQRCLKRLWAVMRADEVRRANASRTHLPPTRQEPA
ncbi:MFS transporter [Antrihabitans cavernicola]|uniref:MFS transporter n=1 Tax=Antrihabitans cavernicola TaxID=2495913 RepID=A0A5A7S1N8_9NOCA|nr:MFS transporter [Spelaeibacter cavernicola]KAA0016357.1 MFS transporter [Spelaeibacter cavernicola]